MLEMVSSSTMPPPHISHMFPFEETAAAFEVMLDRKLVGKVVVEIGNGGGRAAPRAGL